MNERERKRFTRTVRWLLRLRRWHDAITWFVAQSHAAIVDGARRQFVWTVSTLLDDEQREILLAEETEETVRVVQKRQQQEDQQCGRVVN